MPENDDDKAQQKRDRSPSFPYLELDTSIELVKKLLTAAKQSDVRLSSVAELWDTTPTSGSLMRYVAALQAYGLIESSGSGNLRKIKISEAGRRILSDSRPGVREQLCKEAALRPKLISELYSIWTRDRPDDGIAKSQLQFDYNFTPDAARRFLMVYDAAMKFINTDAPTFSPLENDIDSSFPDMPTKSTPYNYPEPDYKLSTPIESRASTELRKDVFTLDEGEVVITMPLSMSASSFQDFSDWIELIKRKVQRSIQID